MKEEFTPGIVPPKREEGPAWWFAFEGGRLLVREEGSTVAIPCEADLPELGVKAIRQHYLGRLGSRSCYAVELPEGAIPPSGMAFQGLRRVGLLLDGDLFSLAGRALQILEWDRTHQFCGQCGSRTETRQAERAKECPQCGVLYFPRLSPAIIVAVTRGPELLLARSPHFPDGMYSVLAGFVEPGETLEQAVAREVREEVGLTIKAIRYFGSQPWPFPHSLMIGFTAAHAGGEISLDGSEIEDAGWYTAENLPPLPSPISIARRLIEWFVGRDDRTSDGAHKARRGA